MIILPLVFSIISVMLSFINAVTGPFILWWNFVVEIYVYIIRPLCVLDIGSIIYNRVYNPNIYIKAWTISAVVNLLANLGFMLTKPNIHKECFSVRVGDSFFHTTRKIVFLTFISTLLMLVIGGPSILPWNRSASMSAVNPLMRYIYPFAMISSALLIHIGIICLLSKDKTKLRYSVNASFYISRNPNFIKAIGMIIIGFVVTGIVYQRGMAVSMALWAFSLVIDELRAKTKVLSFNIKNFKKIFKLVILVVIFVIIGVMLRDIVMLVATKNAKQSDKMSLISNPKLLEIYIVSRADGDKIEVWMILMKYLKENKLKAGETLIKIPATLLPSRIRYKYHLYTGLDVLNDYYQSEIYWHRKFGFNVDIYQELFLNFGMVGLLYSFFIGGISGLVLKWFYKHVSQGYYDPADIVLYVGISWFLGQLSSFQWFVFMSILYLILKGNILSFLGVVRRHVWKGSEML